MVGKFSTRFLGALRNSTVQVLRGGGFFCSRGHCWWLCFRVDSPVDVGSLSHYLQGLSCTIQMLVGLEISEPSNPKENATVTNDPSCSLIYTHYLLSLNWSLVKPRFVKCQYDGHVFVYFRIWEGYLEHNRTKATLPLQRKLPKTHLDKLQQPQPRSPQSDGLVREYTQQKKPLNSGFPEF